MGLRASGAPEKLLTVPRQRLTAHAFCISEVKNKSGFRIRAAAPHLCLHLLKLQLPPVRLIQSPMLDATHPVGLVVMETALVVLETP
ncbi:hypothetical protein H920_06544 [Fukomys damarensis]|uniref:Uncharacterized protein n=1 Tax=Fukomys damarensis TaxID=885580 RepID=A0A091DNV7_FUKDA|nr:hypothetical protein H920_06544 [Fukomys damarensis]